MSSVEVTGEHSFVTIAHAALRLKAEFETLNKKCSEKLTRMCSLEKETWFDLDEMEQECNKQLTQVEKKAERLVRIKKNNFYVMLIFKPTMKLYKKVFCVF